MVAVSGRGSNLWFTVRGACFFGDPQLVLQIEAKRKGWGGLFRGTQHEQPPFSAVPQERHTLHLGNAPEPRFCARLTDFAECRRAAAGRHRSVVAVILVVSTTRKSGGAGGAGGGGGGGQPAEFQQRLFPTSKVPSRGTGKQSLGPKCWRRASFVGSKLGTLRFGFLSCPLTKQEVPPHGKTE